MLVKDYLEENVGANCIDLRLKEIYKLKGKKTVDWEKEELPEYNKISLDKKPYLLKPGEYILSKTIESVKMPTDHIGILFIRTKAFRVGLDIKCSKVDAGYEGELVVGMHNIGNNNIVLRKGFSFLSMMVADLKGNTIPYVSRFMHGRVI